MSTVHVEAGRKGARRRWARASQAEKNASAALAREGITRKYVEQAATTFDRMGVTPTPEQVQTAAENLRVADLRERVEAARLLSLAANAARPRAAQVEFAVDQATAAADALHAIEPTIPDSACMRLCLMSAMDEVNAADGFNRQRLVKRLGLMVNAAEARTTSATDATWAS